MNKKKIALIAVFVVLAVALVLLISQGNKTPEALNTPETNAASSESVAETTPENPAQEKSDETSPAESTEMTEENNGAPQQEEETEPETPTIPAENVQIGVVEGDDDGDIDDSDVNQNTPQPTAPTQPNPGTNVEAEEGLPADFEITSLTYESYNAMNGTQQRQVIEMFASPEEFMKWYKAVEAEYMAAHPEIEIGEDGVIDAGKLG